MCAADVIFYNPLVNDRVVQPLTIDIRIILSIYHPSIGLGKLIVVLWSALNSCSVDLGCRFWLSILVMEELIRSKSSLNRDSKLQINRLVNLYQM